MNLIRENIIRVIIRAFIDIEFIISLVRFETTGEKKTDVSNNVSFYSFCWEIIQNEFQVAKN